MSIKYPQLCPWVVLKKLENDDYMAFDFATRKKYTLSTSEGALLKQLDGKTDPYRSVTLSIEKHEMKHFIKTCIRYNIVRESKIERSSLSLQISLLNIKDSPKIRVLSLVFNQLLLYTFLPSFLIGGYLFYKDIDAVNDLDFLPFMFGVLAGMVIGLIAHEASHMFACLAYGGRVFEVGVKLGLLCGAYVMASTIRIKKRLLRLQIYASGIEMNLLTGGIAFVFASLFTEYSLLYFTFLGVAFSNVILALINALLAGNLDGASVINELLGAGSLLSSAIGLKDKVMRKKYRKEGCIGYIKIAACVISLLLQSAFPVILILNIVSIVSVVGVFNA